MNMSASPLEQLALNQIRAHKLPIPVTEYRFCPQRRWRADFLYLEQKILIEIEGAHWTSGRHTRGSGFDKDCEKYNTAALMGYKVLRVTSTHLKNGQFIEWLKLALNVRSTENEQME